VTARPGARARIALVVLAVLLLLDVGRSVYARLGHAAPAELWQPAPEVYADLAWPPGSDVPAAAPPGRRLYVRWCATCHGPDGRGNGPAAPSLVPRPRDLTRGLFKYKSTPAAEPPTEDDLARVVADGLQASAMPYFRDLLTADEIREVVRYVQTLSPVFAGPGPRPVPIPPRVAADARSVARGRALYTDLGCDGCHGADGRRRETQRDAKGYPVVTRDLTAPWTFAGGGDPEQVWRRLTTLSSVSPMPSYAETATPTERWHVVNYVLSLARTPPWRPGGHLDGPGQHPDPVVRGEYLVHAEMCGLCHTPINPTGIYRGDDFYLAGGMRVEAYPQGVFVSRNLTGDLETGLGRWSAAEIAAAMREGRARGRVLNIWGMPWMFLHRLTDADARAIATYLKTLPPVRNAIPDPLHYGTLETLAVKLTRTLPAVPPRVLTYTEGNFGARGGGMPRDVPQRVLVAAQWLVIVAGVVGWVGAAPRGRRLPHGLRAWLLTVIVVVGGLVVALLAMVVVRLPALAVIPPERIAAATAGRIPRPDPARLGGSPRAELVERGRYLFTVASCALCHGADGAGGAKLSWRALGTVWARNLTPDRETGLGAWSDDEISRAIRGGIAKGGRPLHWQAMIWDHASNWDEEDVRALIAFLRVLPPVRRAIPATRPPSADDCPVYTFWVDASATPGCR
jgi:mono/diheme cytochrome c family protein